MDLTELYRSKLCNVDAAVAEVRSGRHIYIHSNGAAPLDMLAALDRRCDKLTTEVS